MFKEVIIKGRTGTPSGHGKKKNNCWVLVRIGD
jgi:hypothetical protein